MGPRTLLLLLIAFAVLGGCAHHPAYGTRPKYGPPPSDSTWHPDEVAPHPR